MLRNRNSLLQPSFPLALSSFRNLTFPHLRPNLSKGEPPNDLPRVPYHTLVEKGRWDMRHLLNFLREDDAATAVEYAVLLALILMSVIGAIGTVGAQSGGMWGNIEGQLNATPFGR